MKLRASEFLRRSDGSPPCHREGNQGWEWGELPERKQRVRGLGGRRPTRGLGAGGAGGTARDVSLVSCIHVTPSRLPVRYSEVRQGTSHSKNAPAHHVRRPVKNRQCGHRCQAIAGHVAGLTIGP